MLDPVKKCWALLPPRFRLALAGLFVLMNLHAAAQLLMVASFFPFLDAISSSAGSGKGDFVFSLDWLGIQNRPDSLPLVGSLVIGAVVLANGLGLVHGIAVARFSASVNAFMAKRLLRGYLSRPYMFYLNRNSSEFLRTIFSEVDFVTDGFMESAMGACARALTIAGIGTLLLFLNPVITLAAGLFFGASYAAIYFFLRQRLVEAAEKRGECDDARYQAVSEAFGTIKELKILGREPFFLNAFAVPSRDYFRNLEKAQIYSELPRHLVEMIAFAGMVVVALLLLQRHGGVAGALPVLGVFAVAAYRLLPAIKGLYSSISEMRYYRESVDTVFEACRESDGEVEKIEDFGPRLPFRESIEFRNVSFGYPGSGRQVLQGVNLKLPARARIGLFGKSGAGKTTLADLILGLFEPVSGEILVDGIPLNAETRRSWQRNCGYVSQQIYLVDGSVRANIAFGIAPDQIDMERVRTAARLANLQQFVENELSDGYDTEVGERGVRLSGGQRQRIGIARALYHDPEVIVLDEATNALDPETEQAIVDALRALAGRKTVIMIAHRFSTIRESDLLIRVEEGRCVPEKRKRSTSNVERPTLKG